MTAPRPAEEIRADLALFADRFGDDQLGRFGARDRLAADAEPLLSRLAAVERERDEARADAERAKWNPLGDNHHNAAVCPYCSPASIILAERMRAEAAERERDEARASLADVIGFNRANQERADRAERHADGLRRRMETAEARIAAARTALVATGYFTAEQVGDDIAPRITEILTADAPVPPQPEPSEVQLISFVNLLNEPAVAKCDRCGRSTWDADTIGTRDEMTQPDGSACGGTFAALVSPQSTEEATHAEP